MNHAISPTLGRQGTVLVRGGFDPGALAALAGLTLRQHLRGRRLLVLTLLFFLPSVLVAVVRLTAHQPEPAELEFAFVFNMIPHALATLTALLYAAGIIQDEVEEQTLTYLLLRPIPRWALYVVKLAVTMLVTSLLMGVFSTLTFLVIYWNSDSLWGTLPLERLGKTVALLGLAQVAYCSFFGALGLFTRRSLIIGLAYIVGVEGLLASFASIIRQLTVMYYFRVLAVRWLEPPGSDQWGLDLETAPSASHCIVVLFTASAVFVIMGMATIMRREFRVKTPEGS